MQTQTFVPLLLSDGTSRTIRYIEDDNVASEGYEGGRDGPRCGLASTLVNAADFSESFILETGLCELDVQDASNWADFLRDEETGLPPLSSAAAAAAATTSSMDYDLADVGPETLESPAVSGRAAPPAPTPAPPALDLDFFSSPESFLRFIQSEGYKAQQRALRERILASFEILRECPWPLPKPLFVLALTGDRHSVASSPDDGDTGKVYSLRTKLPEPGAATDLSRVYALRNQSASLSVFRMVDGLVTFEDERAAQRYAEALEREAAESAASMDPPGVHVATLDSHYLFRTAGDAKAVVVLVRELEAPGEAPGRFMVEPSQLAAELRGKRSVEELEDLP